MKSSPDINLAGRALVKAIKERSVELGFDRVGIAGCDASRYAGYFRQWVDAGRAGEMRYLESRIDERVEPARYLPGAVSAICVAINYHVPLQPVAFDVAAAPGRIARYALGDDYHELMKSRLHQLADWIRQSVPDCQTRACVDTAPVLEKDLAARAGIGWMGKNTCVIHPQLGSWLLLGEIITTLALPSDEPMEDHCGSCTRCIDACPTQAIAAPYQLDARRCISYLTIEHRGTIPAELQPGIGDWLYGCDICQDVCPFNRKAPTATDPAWKPRFPTGTLDARELLNWTDVEYRARLRGSAMKRVKLPVLQRNASIVAANAEKRAGRLQIEDALCTAPNSLLPGVDNAGPSALMTPSTARP
jgi:epoxyqueuosine reductase